MAGGSSKISVGTLLVVDDEATNRLILKSLLEPSGYQVLEAADGAQALELLAQQPVDLVLLDVVMPGLDGLEVCRRIRQQAEGAYLPVVIITSLDDRETRIKGKAAGCDDFLNKPVDGVELLARVKNLLLLRLYQEQLRQSNAQLEAQVEQRTRELRRALSRLEAAEKEVRLSREETVARLARAAEFRDDQTAHHVRRMSHYCALLARRSGLEESRCELFEVASPLHDVGKIAIPDQILLKPGRLTPEEFETMKRHVEFGHRILGGSVSGFLRLADSIAWTHHERYDGAGYPRRLAGEQIPPEGRIAAIADVFDALSTARVYKPALPLEESLRIMREERGRHFDPGLLDLFLGALDEVLKIQEHYADG